MAKDEKQPEQPKQEQPDLSKMRDELDRALNAIERLDARNKDLEAQNEELKRARAGVGKARTEPAPASKSKPEGLAPSRMVHYFKALPLVVEQGSFPPKEKDPQRELAAQAALIINVHDESGTADLKVWFTTGAEHTLKRVPYAEQPTRGAWSWPARV